MLQFLQPMLSLLPKRKWVRDSATDHCYECCIKIKSGLFSTNKHHCRYCGNIVCNKCSGSTYKKHRVCDSCNKLINKAESFTNSFNENDSDSDSEEKEELSPYNTPMLKYKEFSQDTMDEMDIIDYISIDDISYNTHNIHSSFNNNYINSFNNNNNYNPFDIMIDDHYNEYEYNKREYNIRKYLVYGFVRKCWKTLLQFNSNELMKEFPCNYIMDLLINIISISDSFNEYYTNLNIIISNKPIYHLKSYRNVQIIERRKEWNTQCYHTFGNDIITRGSKQIWKFKICGYNNNSPCIVIGIIETSKIKNFVNNYDGSFNSSFNSFNDEWNKGYALYTADWNIYHKDTKGIPFTDNCIRLNITPNDVIAMEVDLTQKYVLNYNNKNISKSLMSLKEYKSKSQCGTIKYIFNGKTDVFKNDGIAFNNIDINKTYQLAIGMYLKDKLAMFQIL
eukprot:175766_1